MSTSRRPPPVTVLPEAMKVGDGKRLDKAVTSQGPPRLALTPNEAAQSLGCSRDFFDEHIGPDLHWV